MLFAQHSISVLKSSFKNSLFLAPHQAHAESRSFSSQVKDYVLHRLRDQPGQLTLAPFKPQPLTRSVEELHAPKGVATW